MNKVIISLEDYKSLKEKAEKWDKSQFSPELVNEKIKSDLTNSYLTNYCTDIEGIKIEICNIISDLPDNSLLGLTSCAWIKLRLNDLVKLIKDLKKEKVVATYYGKDI